MLTFRHISHVLALHRYGSFRRAASSLNISNPAFSRSIARAEDILGERLFDRGPEGAVPTIFGQLLIERGQALLDGKKDIVREFNLMRGIDGGEIVIAAGPYAAEISGYLAAARMLGRYPALKIRMLTCRFQEATERVCGARQTWLMPKPVMRTRSIWKRTRSGIHPSFFLFVPGILLLN